MKRIGIFGGSFDPPQFSHKVIIDSCLKQKLVDEVWVLPAYSHRQKENIATFNQRLDMCELMFRRWFVPIKVLHYDLYNLSSSSHEMINLLSKWFDRKYTFSIIIGRDCADNIETWLNYEELIATVPFIVFDRRDYISCNPKEWYRSSPNRLIEVPGCDFSSTYVRRLLGNHLYKLATLLTNKKLIGYIQQEKLYENPPN